MELGPLFQHMAVTSSTCSSPGILKNDLKMILIREHVIKSTGIKGSLVQGEGIESLRAEWVPAVRR